MSLNKFLEVIELEISKTSYGQQPIELYEPISYIMALGGKRMRPALTLMAASMFTDDWQNSIKPAIAIEVFHNFTLMHDDIMDDAPLRRGKATVHEKWNPNVAILSGDVMLVAAYDLLLDIEADKFKKVIKRFNRTAAEVCEGQQFDMNFSSRNDVTEAEYINMIRLKTSVLLGFALELGGIIAGADQKSIDDLYSIGVNMGIGFQLKDDILDVYGDPEKFGKQVGGDIIENKKTWLMLKAMELSKQNNDDSLNTWLQNSNFEKEEKVAAITEIYNSYSIKELAEDQMNAYFEKGLESLSNLAVNENKKESLREFAAYLMAREN